MIPENGRQTSPVAFNRTLVASAARTASGNSGALNGWSWARDFTFMLDVTAAGVQVTDTLNVYVQRLLPDNTTYDDIASFTQVVGNGGAKQYVADIRAEAVAGVSAAPSDGALTAGTIKNAYVGDTIRVKWVIVGAGEVAATGTLTLTQNAADTNTVTIGANVYTFQTVLTNVANNVLIGATASDSIDNLIAAITAGAGSGTTYAAATVVHPTVTAAVGAGDTMGVTALTAGSAGNSIATTDTLAGASAFGAATLTGGVGAVDDDTFTFVVYANARG